MRLQLVVQLLQSDARIDNDTPVGNINITSRTQTRQAQHDLRAAHIRRTGTHHARVGTLRQQRQALCNAQPHHGLHLRHIGRAHHQTCMALAITRALFIGRHIAALQHTDLAHNRVKIG